MSKFSRCAGIALGALLLAAPVAKLSAQDANRDMVDTRSDVGDVVNRVQRLSGEFKGSFDRAVEHSMIDGTRLESNAKHRADDLHDAANKLGDVFHSKRDKNNPAVRAQVDRTIAAASELDRVMIHHRFTDQVQRQWEMLRSDLNALAQIYGLSPLEGGPAE